MGKWVESTRSHRDSQTTTRSVGSMADAALEQFEPADAAATQPARQRSARFSGLWPPMRMTQMSAFTTLTLASTFSDKMEQLGLGLEELKSTMATPAVNSGTQMKILCLLILNPVVRGYRAVGIGFAKQESEGFSVVMPALLSSLVQLFITLVLLLVMDGLNEARRLLNRRYIIMIFPGFAAGAMILLANMAFARLATSVVTLLLQTSALFAVLLQCGLFHRIPSHTQILSLLATGCLLPVYFMATNEDAEDGTGSNADVANGIVFALAGAFSTACYNISFEWANKKCKLKTDDFAPALKRAMVGCEVGRLLSCILLLLTMDYDFVVNKGVFYNFDVAVLVGATGGLVVQGFFASLCLAFVGAVMTRLSSSLEIIVVYIADLVLLQTAEFEADNMLILMAIFAVVLLYHISALDQQKAARAGALTAILSAQKMIEDEKNGERTPRNKRTLATFPSSRRSDTSRSSHYGSQTDEAESKRASALLSLEENGTRGSVWSGTTDEAAAQRASVLLSLQGDEDEAAALRISTKAPHEASANPHEQNDGGVIVPKGASRGNAQVLQARAVSRSSEGNLEVGREGAPSSNEGSRPLLQSGSGPPLEDEVYVGALGQQMLAQGDVDPHPVLLGRSLAPCWNQKFTDLPAEGIAGHHQPEKPVLCSITCNM